MGKVSTPQSSTTEATPGPWEWTGPTVTSNDGTEVHKYSIDVGRRNAAPVAVLQSKSYDDVGSIREVREIMEANAQLIAAAPDMFAEIEEAIGWIESMNAYGCSTEVKEVINVMYERFKAVLSKARGGQK